jgi:hypothetical protein
MQKRNVYIVACCVGIAGCIGFLISNYPLSAPHQGTLEGRNSVIPATPHPNERNSSNSSKPVPQLKVLSGLEKLNAPALDKDQLRDQQFRKGKQCFAEKKHVFELENQIIECEANRDTNNEAVRELYTKCHLQTPALTAQVSKERESMRDCGKDTDIVNEYYSNATRAAKSGDSDAQLCYVESMFGSGIGGRAGRRAYSDSEIAEYESNAPNYIQEGFLRGDWRVAALLSQTPSRANGLLGTIFQGDTLTLYEMNRLLRLGAVGGYAQTLDNDVQLNLLAPDRAIDPLSPDQIQVANDWAQEIYARYFQNSPKISQSPSVCNLLD